MLRCVNNNNNIVKLIMCAYSDKRFPQIAADAVPQWIYVDLLGYVVAVISRKSFTLNYRQTKLTRGRRELRTTWKTNRLYRLPWAVDCGTLNYRSVTPCSKV